MTLRSPLHHPAFRRLWVGLVISRLGDQFTLIALIWFVLQLTGSGVAIGQGQVFGARGALSVAGYPIGGATGGLLMEGMAAPFVIGISALLCIGLGCACLVSRSNQKDIPLLPF